MKALATAWLVLLSLDVFEYARATGEQHCSKDLVGLASQHFNARKLQGGVCKVWPYDNSKTIAAFHTRDGDSTTDDDRLLVMVIENQATVVAGYQSPALWYYGRSYPELRIDTARYDVTEDVRAFGIDIYEQSPASCPDGGSGARRNLFVIDDGSLRLILENFLLSKWRFSKGWHTRCGPAVESVIEEKAFFISLGDETSNGYRNLVITEKTWLDNLPDDKVSRQYKLIYSGKKYLVPD